MAAGPQTIILVRQIGAQSPKSALQAAFGAIFFALPLSAVAAIAGTLHQFHWMESPMPTLDEYLDQHAPQFEQELCELLRIPSVSAASAHRNDIRAAANWWRANSNGWASSPRSSRRPGIRSCTHNLPSSPGRPRFSFMATMTCSLPIRSTSGFRPPSSRPCATATCMRAAPPMTRGKCLTHIKSAEAWIKTAGRLPINLKYLIEGEEEVGSANLATFVDKNHDRLACDIIVISDTSQFAPGQPAITYGLKGIAYFELRLTGPSQDLHSGVFGGAVTNPANALVRMLTALVNDRGQVQVPGFYDDVLPISDAERAAMRKLNFDERDFMKQLGVDAVTGEDGYTTLERRWARPTCDISGLTSGYQGEGAKTVLPAKASAKFSFRLVPNQTPEKVSEPLAKMLEKLCPPGIKMELISFHGAPGVVVPLESPYMSAASRAIEAGFGRAPVFIREGGSIPVVSTFHEKLGVDTLLLGWGQNDDNRTVRTRNFAWRTSIGGSKPAPTCGRN